MTSRGAARSTGVWRAATAVLLALLLPACGDEDAEVDDGQARLVIRKSLPPLPVDTDASIDFLCIVRASTGEVIAEGQATDPRQPRGQGPLFGARVPPGGSTRVINYQRTCQGNCSSLDAPTARCQTTVELEADET